MLSELIVPGTTVADVYVRVHREVKITPDAVNTQTTQGLAVRVAANDKLGFAFTEEPGLADVLRIAREARIQVVGGREATGAKVSALARVALPRHYAASPSRPEVFEREQAILRTLVQRCGGLDPDVVVRADWAEHRTEVLIADERGRLVRDIRPLSTITLICDLARGVVVPMIWAPPRRTPCVTC